MSRSTRFLEWADPSKDELTARSEVALVREVKNEDGETLRDIVEEFLGEPYTDQFLTADEVQSQWFHAHLTNSQFPNFSCPEEDGHILSHAIFWSNDYGLSPQYYEDAAQRVRSALIGVNNDPELLGQFILSSIALGVEPPANRLQELQDYFDQEWGDWPEEYHPRCVAALVFALRED